MAIISYDKEGKLILNSELGTGLIIGVLSLLVLIGLFKARQFIIDVSLKFRILPSKNCVKIIVNFLPSV